MSSNSLVLIKTLCEECKVTKVATSPIMVLLDDMPAWDRAQTLGFSVKGTLGVIAKGYRTQMLSLDEVGIIFDSIVDRNDIWIAEELCRRVFEGLKNSK